METVPKIRYNMLPWQCETLSYSTSNSINNIQEAKGKVKAYETEQNKIQIKSTEQTNQQTKPSLNCGQF